MNPLVTEQPLILLVDDVPANLHVLATSLRNQYRIKTAINGQMALDLASREDKPQLILLDVMMPDMSGIEVLRRLREQVETRDIPVIFVTADMSEQNQLDGLELGADDYLTKPVVTTILLARVRNLIERKQTEANLRLAAHVFEHSGEGILITDQENRIVDVNPAFTRMTGYSLEEVRGKNPDLLASGRTSPEVFQQMWKAVLGNGMWQGEVWNRNKDGGVVPLMMTVSVVRRDDGVISYYIGSYVDLSQQKATEEHIRFVAHHDALTGLPNRLHLQAALPQSILAARREKTELSVMFIDLDRFKQINDTLGHSIGDALLIEVAQRLTAVVRESDFVARLGGDEFIVVLRFSPGQAEQYSRQVADKILTSISPPYRISGHSLDTTPSIGIALFPQDGEDMDSLMKCADITMYEAKEAGRGRYCFYSADALSEQLLRG